MKIKNFFIYNHLVNIFLYISIFLISDNIARSYIKYIYLILIFNHLLVISKKNYVFLLFTPTSLILLYTGLSFAIGSYAFNEGLVLKESQIIAYNNWDYFKWSNVYVLTALILLFYVDHFFSNVYIHTKYNLISRTVNFKAWYIILFLCIVLYLIFSFIELDLSIFGSDGDLSNIPKTTATLTIIYYLAINKIKKRYVLYLLILIIFASLNITSKREAIFLIFPIGLLESFINLNKFRIQHVFVSLMIILFCLSLILIMSIARGYGGYDLDYFNILQAIPFLFDYLTSELFLESFFNNIETNYTFFHSFQALEYIQNDINLLSYGSTIIKVLFILIPRSIFPMKPDSILELYTSEYSPSFRLIGGSYPINIISEYFWNFHFIGIIVVLLMAILVNYFFLKLIKHIGTSNFEKRIWMLYAYMHLITYVRGSGLDQYIVYVLIGYLFSKLISDLSNILIYDSKKFKKT